MAFVTINRLVVEGSWHSRGFSCAVWVDPPGQVWEDYVHSTDELVMLIEGTLEFAIEGRVSRPEIGQEVCIPAGIRHSVRNVGGTTARWLYGYKYT
ncbi:hypothetical protein YTPLAS18_19000 [Nitrospira sp.]|nr:hypothetical protein YTPLAS18_19000 [Nitrospira sp.]